MATFGGGHDLSICNNCHESEESISNLGVTYCIPENIYSEEDIQSYLAGSNKFKVTEIEVFRIF